ncbi:MAG: PCYCGC domain-containing protein [Acidimicrobiia bacterium]|nr:PCYCGC domain-containing protein [Acidimicrobiia bacterium]
MRKLKRYANPQWLFLLAVLFLGTACAPSPQRAFDLVHEALLPDFLADAPPAVKEAYRFAAANPDELEKYPCYCGCGAMGHTSNLSCYVSDVAADGRITFDSHAAGCGICVDITRDVMRLMNEGKEAPEIRQYIDATYSAFGPSTDTPFPQE